MSGFFGRGMSGFLEGSCFEGAYLGDNERTGA